MEKVNNYPLSFYKSFQMCVASYSANLIIPGKMGELIRLFWIEKNKSKYPNLFLILFEKSFDLFSLFLIFYFSLFFSKGFSNLHGNFFLYTNISIGLLIISFFVLKQFRIPFLINYVSIFNSFLRDNYINTIKVFFQSLFLWFVQIMQFYFLFKAFSIDIYPVFIFAGSSLSVLSGALIFSIGGIGPRDATLLYFFNGFVNDNTLLSIGLLTSLRIIIPALIGLPFLINLSKNNERK